MPIKIFEIGPFALVSAWYKRNKNGKIAAITIPARAEKPKPKTGAYCPKCKSPLQLFNPRTINLYGNWYSDGAFAIGLLCFKCDWRGWGEAILWGLKEEAKE